MMIERSSPLELKFLKREVLKISDSIGWEMNNERANKINGS